ncbi:MAG: M28 family peptidase, partial [Burkholderiales bacterium]|nr:M28 family peptidase [Burkholderiales bacterium]
MLTALLVVMVDLPAAAAEAAAPAGPEAIVQQVDPAALRATVQALVGFGTRHTMSDTKSATRGIGAARRWVRARFEAISAACGGCLEVVSLRRTVTGPVIPTPTEVVDIVAIQRGSADPNRVLAITGHLDSRVTDILNATSDAPGANDDASGVAAVMEAAR